MVELVVPATWPLMGRDAPLRAVRAALQEGSVVVAAPAGEGKSRLAREALAAEDQALTRWVQATRSAAAIPLAAFADLLPEDVLAADTSRLMRRSAEELEQRARGRRIVLGVDDAQLLDPVSASLVAFLSERGVRVLATIRSGEPLPPPIATLPAQRIELGPLDDRTVAALVEAVLGGPVEEAASRWAVETSRGNPLYVRELVAGAVRSGALAEADGLWRLMSRPGVAVTLRELIAARLDRGRDVVERLSLSEPLTTSELVAMTSEAAVQRAAALVMIDGENVRLAHPLYGEVAAAGLPALRGLQLRRQLAETLQRRRPLTPDVALRVARLLTDAGAEIPSALRLDAARAANLAGDPDFGADLAAAALAEGGLPAALLLARAHMLRNRPEEAEAVLAAVESDAPGDPLAFDYIQMRAWNLTWGLHRLRDATALFDRALAWSEDTGWVKPMTLLRRRETAVGEGFSILDDIQPALADPALPAEERLLLEALAAISSLYAGDGVTAAGIARRIRPQVPLRTLGQAAALTIYSAVAVETGDGWAQLEAYMGDALREGVRAGDHEAAGAAALTLALLSLHRGRYRDAARWHAEAELHVERHDTLGARVYVAATRVAIATATGDFDGADAGLARIEAFLNGREPLPNQTVVILRAHGWAKRLRNNADAVEAFLAAARQMEHAPIMAASLLYEALRAGAEVAPPMREAAARATAPMLDGYLGHAEARAARDGAKLLAAGEMFADIGALRYAMEAAAEASAVFLQQGRRDSARRAAERARALHPPGQGTEPPRIDGLERPADELTPRETQIVELARRGLSNAEIAERLVVSQRTVETHVYRAMLKLGVSDRRDL